ncbi:hypothetical protein BRADI_1g60195v3 [Brachypodium distachyon]|uniref:Uncharacterized protein n=1 Tax=Brachypodium distachyon TaxID=15368 RepID=A0A2K2DSM3_BRADI|nr:hypothetical protein BRADI_1g60195v3 [Brachypodium distachyon]
MTKLPWKKVVFKKFKRYSFELVKNLKSPFVVKLFARRTI